MAEQKQSKNRDSLQGGPAIDVAEVAPVMAWTIDAQGHCTWVNRAWCEHTGQRRDEALGEGWMAAVHPEDRERIQREFRASAPRAARIEYRLRRHDGQYCWVIDQWKPHFNPDGSLVGAVGCVLDVDELKRTQQQLAASNARFHAAIDAVAGVLWTNDADGRMVGEQPGWSALTGQDQATYSGYGWAAAVHPDDVEATIAAWQEAVKLRKPFHFEHRLRRSDGQWRSYSVRAIPTLNPDGSVREWVGVHSDITHLRTSEAALRALNARLEAGIEERTRERDRMWGMSQDIMAVATSRGYFTSVNPAFTRILGWSEQEACSVPFMELVHPEHRQDLLDKLPQLAAGQPLVRYEVRDLHKDGSARWLSWTIVPEGDTLYGVARDITQEKEQAEALRQAQAALQQAQKMEAVGQLTGGLAHDFNNLLASVVGNLELLRMKAARLRDADIIRHADAALAVTDRASALTHRLLAFSRQQTLAPQVIDVNTLVRSLADMVQRTVGPAIRLQTQFDAQAWPVRCDPNQLESALLNLVINARDAMPHGGELRITTGMLSLGEQEASQLADARPGDYTIVSVADTGTGMPPDVAERAFDPFFTTKPLGQGTGLGLSMIYGFVQQSGGYVRLVTTPGQGTDVRLMLPRHAGPLEPAGPAPTPTDLPQGAEGARLLVVDDDEALRYLLGEMLDMMGYRCITAQNAAEGLRILESGEPVDLLVSDVGLPGMNGRQFADLARKLRPQLKVLFITGYAEDVATRNGTLAPGMRVVTKPFVMDTLAQAVRDMLVDSPAPPAS